jgi:hypothetical protein
MNIFYLDRNPYKAAEQHYNKHVVKMVLEAAQLLCTAHHISGDGNVPYKKTHANHPSAVWVRSSKANYLWCYEYMLALGKEYTKRYGKSHLTIEKCREVLSKVPFAIHISDFSDPPQCMPDEYKMADAVDGYKKYYELGKSHLKDKL